MDSVGVSSTLATMGDYARVGVFAAQACLEPVSIFRRVLSGERIPLDRILPRGTTVKFLSSLKFNVLPPSPGILFCVTHPIHSVVWLVSLAMMKRSGELSDYKNMSSLEGNVSMFSNPPFSEFPFEKPLTILRVETHAVSLADENGVTWKLPAFSFATVNQITVLKQ